MTWFTEADVEAAAEAYEMCPPDMGSDEAMRFALAAIPDPRAAGFLTARDEIYTETARMWPEAVDLLECIAALKPEDKP